MEHSVTISSYHPDDEYQVLHEYNNNDYNDVVDEEDQNSKKQDPWSMKELLLDETNIDNLAQSIMPEIAP